MRPIDADKLKVCLEKYEYVNASKSAERGGNEVLHYFMSKVIDDEPTLDYTPVKRGRWISDESTLDSGFIYCSCCRVEFYIEDLMHVGNEDGFCEFCPHCGADMRGEKNDKRR